MPIRNILVVEDSPTDRQFLAEILTSGGYHVSAVASAEEARAQIRDQRPDLVLMDIVMPGENGFQATRALTRDEATRDIPIILCTSKGQPTDRIWGMRQGARDFVVKPVRRDDLLSRIAALG